MSEQIALLRGLAERAREASQRKHDLRRIRVTARRVRWVIAARTYADAIRVMTQHDPARHRASRLWAEATHRAEAWRCLGAGCADEAMMHFHAACKEKRALNKEAAR